MINKIASRFVSIAVPLSLIACSGIKPKSAKLSEFVMADKVVRVYITAKNSGSRLQQKEALKFITPPITDEKFTSVFIDPEKTFQSVIGIGGALTDASAETFYKLPKNVRDTIITKYYDVENGIGYSLARTHINSCDFSSEMYTYTAPNDKSLQTFNISHDLKYRVPFIKEALAAANQKLTLFVSPWSPPAWMKTNNDMLNGGKLKEELSGSWADYFVKFIQAYEKQGIPIWGLTVQNEPAATQPWESCRYTAEEERDFVKNHLGPILRKEKLGDKKVIVWDHNRHMMYDRAKVIFDDKEASKYIWGLGYHWYGGDNFENAELVKSAFPNKNLLFTEGCQTDFKIERISDWSIGERYGTSMINDFNNGVVGWTDWNILLDEQGGPNHVKNYCFAPIHANVKTGELSFVNSYYYIGHFSKFVRPGAKRIISSSMNDNLMCTAFINADNSIVVVVMNKSEKDMPFYLRLKGKAAKTVSPGRSIITMVL